MHDARILERDGCPIHYWLTGPADAPVIIFTHGAQVDHRMFDKQVAALADDYRILSWDMRGHGQSQPLQGELSYSAVAQDIMALMDEIGAEHAILVGHSMGGCGSQEVAFSAPERVRALVLIGSPCVTAPNLRGTKIYARMLRLLGYILPEKAYRRFMGGSARLYSVLPDVQSYIRMTTEQVSKAAFMAMSQAVRTGYHPEPDYHVAAPLLITHGDQDLAAIREQAPDWAAREPHGQYVVIPQASHNANQDNWKFFNTTLRNYLAELA